MVKFLIQHGASVFATTVSDNETSIKKCEEDEEGFEAFKIGVMMHELRKELGMTQEQLAAKCGTTKNYISRIENNASDIRLSTLMRIFREGFGRQLKLSIK